MGNAAFSPGRGSKKKKKPCPQSLTWNSYQRLWIAYPKPPVPPLSRGVLVWFFFSLAFPPKGNQEAGRGNERKRKQRVVVVAAISSDSASITVTVTGFVRSTAWLEPAGLVLNDSRRLVRFNFKRLVS